ncbi:MAG TPA: type VI secretion system-associated protein TagO [Arsenophonus nasoniae]|uniref:type VI secretion system-associated protein TagO n=1 Tax=Arsenophonus nasoniae TaxID=638 RepID=UPI003879E581
MKKILFLFGLFFINITIACSILADEAKNDWIISTSTSEIDDSQTVILEVKSEHQIYTRLYESITPYLIIRCQNNKTDVYINWWSYLGLDETKIITRIDKEKASSKWWNISTDNKAAFYPGNVIKFINSLFGKNKLFAQVTPYGESPVKATFNITGLSDKIIPLRKSCGW